MISNVLKELLKPEIFLCLFVVIGNLIIKKRVYEIIASIIKIVIGYKIFEYSFQGISVFFKEFLINFENQLNVKFIMLDPYISQISIQSAIEKIGITFTYVLIVLLLGYLTNLLLVKFKEYTKIRTIFTTCHIQLQHAIIAFWIFYTCLKNINVFLVIVISGIVLGIYWAISTNTVLKSTQVVTNGAGFSISHQQMFGIVIYEKICSLLFKNSTNFDEKNNKKGLPNWLKMFAENTVASFIFISIFLLIGLVFIRFNNVTSITNEININYIVTNTFEFVACTAVLQLGIRIFVGEISNIFQSINMKFATDAVLSLDSASIFGFCSNNTINFGFLFGLLGELIGIIILLITKSFVIPMICFVPTYFDNASIACHIYKQYGNKAANFVCFINGLLQSILPSIFIGHFSVNEINLLSNELYAHAWLGMFDCVIVWPLIGLIIKNFTIFGVILVILSMLIIPIVEYKKDPEGYELCYRNWEKYKESRGNL